MPAVFISYRRDDSKGFAGALLRELGSRIGADQVFMDFEDIQGGTDFPAVLEDAVGTSQVLLALIGPRWLDARDARGARRLDDASDFVRREIVQALQAGTRVVPVLVDGARMPSADELPADLQPLATRHALELSNHRWAEDTARLTDHVREGLYAVGTDRAATASVAPDFFPVPPMGAALKRFMFVSLGLGVLFGAVAVGAGLHQWRFVDRAQTAWAEVMAIRPGQTQDGKPSYRPELRFVTADGQPVSFVSGLGRQSPAYAVGEKVKVLYDPLRPDDASIDSVAERWVLPIAFAAFAVLLCVTGALVWGSRRLRVLKARRLLATGKPIATTFGGVEQDTRVSVNDRHPFVVLSEWRNPVSRELVRFRSGPLWEDPTEQARDRMITVVVDPNNFRDYAMDLSFLKSSTKVPGTTL